VRGSTSVTLVAPLTVTLISTIVPLLQPSGSLSAGPNHAPSEALVLHRRGF
ncbi:uncharacterized protein METZ01_LOCUS25415, partial [marine metagenome]